MNNSNKILVFLLGLSLGLLAGAGFFIFKIDTYIHQLTIFKTSKDTIIALTTGTPNYDNNGSIVSVKAAAMPTTQPTNDSLITPQTPLAKNKPDTVDTDSMDQLPIANDIIIRTDELTAVKTLEIRNLTVPDRYASAKKTDSLLQVLSGIRDDSKLAVTSYRVEFWQSPFNYMGFKMTKNRLLLFGISPYADVKLYTLDDRIYLKYQLEIYKLNYTGAFEHLQPIRDPILVSKINQDNLLLQE